jgi:hypothetical protein
LGYSLAAATQQRREMTDPQSSSKCKTWVNEKNGVEIKALLAEDLPFEATKGAGVEIADLWILFLSILSNDYWVAYGVVDNLNGEPQDSLDQSNLSELKKMSIVIGDRWWRIAKEPMQNSVRHRMLADDARVVNDIIMEMSFSELQERRALIDWESVKRRWEKFPMVLSLN